MSLRALALSLAVLLFVPGCVLASVVKETPLPRGGRAVLDVPYHVGADFDDVKHRLNLFIPPGAGPHPVVVFVHGGGWWFGDRNGSLDVYERLGHRLASRGMLAVITSYRLSPEHRHPAHIEDVSRALAWTARNISRYGGDPGQLFAMGHSAGAHLVALAACDRRWLAGLGTTPEILQGVIPISGPFDVGHLGRSVLFGGARLVHPAFGVDAEVWRDVTPATHLREGRPPPFLVAWADGDPALLRKHGAEFAHALRLAGVPVETHEAFFKGHFSVILDLGEEGDPLGDLIEAYVKRSASSRAGR